jgi:L-fucose dehydrogenase
MSVDLGLKDKIFLVSGGGSGVGAGITRACLAEGAKVVVAGRVTESVTLFMQEMRDTGAACELVRAELGHEDECAAIIEKTLSLHGRLDGLVNNAGVNDRIGLERGTPGDFSKSLQQNLTHYYSLAHFAVPALRATRGSIVNVASKVAFTGQGGTSAYAAAKGAQLALTREWAVELLPYGIRVNAIVPAEVMTPLYRRWIDSFPAPEAKLAGIVNRIPLEHRMTTPAEIGSAAAFLLSPLQSSHTTGQHIFIDGGYAHLDRAITE